MKKITLSEAQKMFPGVDILKLHSSLGALGFQVDPEGDGWVRPNTQKEHLKKAGTVKTEQKAAAARANGKLGGRPKKQQE